MSLPAYPMERSDPYDVPPALADLASRGPVDRVRLWDGSAAWIVTGWREARAVLADNRFSADVGKPGYPHLRPGFRGTRLAGAAGGAGGATMLRMDPPAHDVLRRLLTGFFTVRRIATMRPMVQERADACLDAVEAAGPPCDLISTLAVPLPSLVLCELLGVPVADRPHFEELSVALIDASATQRQLIGTLRGLTEYLEKLVAGKEESPGTDIISALLHGPVHDGRMSRADLLGTARLLLTAGHETSASMTSLALATLLRDRTAWDHLGSTPEAVPAAVEELLRFHTIASAGLSRVATADVTVADRVIRAGEGVIVSVEAANRDPEAFEDPGELRFDRGARHHLSFGYGVHQCLGQALARVELQVAIERTIRRFPTMRVADGEDRLEFAHDRMIHGVHRLEVTW